MKKVRKIFFVFILIVFYCYFVNISNFPNKIFVYDDSKIEYRLCPFLKLDGEIATSFSKKSSIYNMTLSLGNIDIKNVELKRAQKLQVVPCR